MDGYKWALVVVYGPAQNNLKEQFLTELVNIEAQVKRKKANAPQVMKMSCPPSSTSK